MNRPVSKGEQVKLTSEWYNKTLPQRNASLGGVSARTQPVEDKREALISGGTCYRYEPAALTNLVNWLDKEEFIPVIDGTKSSITECNWVIPQEEGDNASTRSTVLTGVTRAKVTIADPTHQWVKWDPDGEVLISTNEPDKAQLLIPAPAEHASEPSLIYLGKCGGGSGSGGSWMQFIVVEDDTDPENITNKIINRQVKVRITLAQNSPQGAVGDIVTVHDPYNLFSNTWVNCIGFAYWNSTNLQSGEDPRWEIETCSQPVNRVKLNLKECLLAYNISKLNVALDTEYKESDWPYVSPIPDTEVDYTDPNNPLLYGAENVYKLTSPGSTSSPANIWAERVTTTDTSTTIPFSPGGGSSPTVEWRIVDVEDHIAKWIQVSWQDGSWQYSYHWDGAIPDQYTCPYTISSPFPTTCLDNNDIGVGSYNPEQHEYTIISTHSALLGKPEQVVAVTPNNDSGISTVTCAGGAVCISTDINAETFYAFKPCDLTPVVPEPNSICIDSIDLLSCLDICTYICTYCDSYASPTLCPPPPCGICTFVWDDTNQVWDSSDGDACAAGCTCPPAPTDPGTPGEDDVRELNCIKIDPPECGQCIWTWDGAAWSSSGDNCAPGCECDTVEPSEPGIDPGDTSSVPCVPIIDPPENCEATPCTWKWNQAGGGWSIIESTACDAASVQWDCDCIHPDRSGAFDGEEAEFPCAVDVPGGLGREFLLLYPALFQGCSCKKDIVAVMNRWEKGNVPEGKIDLVVKTMMSKNSSLNKVELTNKITEFVQ